ncbi:MAG: glycogen debranching enzyme family protein [Phycisphaerales bacterium]|nr:glycogen debranching enzyme family protein [Phycisphaerales bacterium]
MQVPDPAEWLEADGLGGFASGTAGGPRTRRYHALLLVAVTPPTGRMVLVNGAEVYVSTSRGTFPLSTQNYSPGVLHPGGSEFIQSFGHRPWPRWVYRLPDGTEIVHEVFISRRAAGPVTVMTWRAERSRGRVSVSVRPLMSGRDYHSTHHENAVFNFAMESRGPRVTCRPYPGVPATTMSSSGVYRADAAWYRNFQYDRERERGLAFTEDLASPGEFALEIEDQEGVVMLSAGGPDLAPAPGEAGALRAMEAARRGALGEGLGRSAEDYLVRRGRGRTIIAGYPWFTDWGRDTFISVRGLCLATGRLEEAGRILCEWAEVVSEGMVPNRFPDGSGEPEYNSVDASLWFVIATHEYLEASGAKGKERAALQRAVREIVEGYEGGTRFGIRADRDALLAAGTPGGGVQLTWMDAKVGDWVVTPRVGKPVEVQALWINALRIAGTHNPRWLDLAARATRNFEARFWDEARGQLHDVVDVDHEPGKVDPACRPNQVFAVGGLPQAILEGSKARKVVDTAVAKLLTPMGLRTLAPGEPGYCPRFDGGPLERDAAYHNGTVWPWLMGPFIEAWVRVRGSTTPAKEEARRRFLEPLLRAGAKAGLGHLPEVADGEAPHRPGGCPFQAWSVGESVRMGAVLGSARASQ